MRPLVLYVEGRISVMTKSPSYLPSRYWSSSAFLMTNSPMEVARRPTLKSPFLPWMVLMAIGREA